MLNFYDTSYSFCDEEYLHYQTAPPMHHFVCAVFFFYYYHYQKSKKESNFDIILEL